MIYEDDIDNSDVINNDVPDSSLFLELGDIIEIISPTNSTYNEKTFYISYIDLQKINIINVVDGETFTLNIKQIGSTALTFTDESITEINLLSRSDVPGFARQNNLIVDNWIDIYFIGEIPVVITGIITNLEEDCIELTSFPAKDVIYIDFEYKGIPEDLFIEKIIIRDPPSTNEVAEANEIDFVADELMEDENYSIETDDSSGKIIIEYPKNGVRDENARNQLHILYANSNELLFEGNLEDIRQVVEIPENEKKYNIEIQIKDFVDEYLSTISNKHRTNKVMNTLFVLVERFKELRKIYSVFNSENEEISGKKTFGYLFKPLLHDTMQYFKEKSCPPPAAFEQKWIIPVVSQRKKFYETEFEQLPDALFFNETESNEELIKIYDIQNKFLEDKTITGTDESRYNVMMKQLDYELTPLDFSINENEYLIPKQSIFSFHNTNSSLETIVSNFDNDDLYSTVIKNKLVEKHKYFNQKYTSYDNGKININSFIIMPYSLIYSSFYKENILSLSLQSKNTFYKFNYFKKTLDSNKYIIDNLNNEIQWQFENNNAHMKYNIKQNYKSPNVQVSQNPFKLYFLINNLRHFVLDDSLKTENESEENKIEKMLNVIIPNTAFISSICTPFRKELLFSFIFY